MRDTLRFGLILLSVFLFQCNGSPPVKDAMKAPSVSYRYTDQEDKLIIEVLSRIPGDGTEMTNKAIWEHVADKHREKWIQKTHGFPQERSPDGLRSRFSIMERNQQHKTEVPENLWKRFHKFSTPDLNKSARGRRRPYTQDEEEFIIEELSKPCYTKAYASTTLDALHAIHNTKRQAKTRGFENERNAKSLCSHIYTMEQQGRLPEAVVKKIVKHDKDARNSQPTTSNHSAALKEPNESED